MDFEIIAIWLAGGIIVSGIIQWSKSLSKNVFTKEIPSWIWVVLLPIVSFIAAFAIKNEDTIWNALGIWSISQIGYETIIQSVKNKLKVI